MSDDPGAMAPPVKWGPRLNLASDLTGLAASLEERLSSRRKTRTDPAIPEAVEAVDVALDHLRRAIALLVNDDASPS